MNNFLLLTSTLLAIVGAISAAPIDLNDAEFDFNILPPTTTPDADSWDAAFGASNTIGPFQFDLEGYEESDGFTVNISGNCQTPSGTLGGTIGTGLAQQVVLISPTVAYASETWCVLVELSLPENGVPKVLSSLEYSFTVNVPTSGSFTLTTTAQVEEAEIVEVTSALLRGSADEDVDGEFSSAFRILVEPTAFVLATLGTISLLSV